MFVIFVNNLCILISHVDYQLIVICLWLYKVNIQFCILFAIECEHLIIQ